MKRREFLELAGVGFGLPTLAPRAPAELLDLRVESEAPFAGDRRFARHRPPGGRSSRSA